MTLLERLGVELPVVQAGLGGGIARHELAAAVSEAGGLGTIGLADPGRFRGELAAVRSATGRPIAANLLLPFTRRAHCEAAAEADVVVTFWGAPRRRTPGLWLHQCGSVEEALDARAAGADGVIVQGRESGGHVRGAAPALDLLERARAALPEGYPVLVAGGIAETADVRTALEAGADAAVLGTRFLLSEESRAHAGYKRRAVTGGETLLTTLFGAGWPAPHRVLPNAATERWLSPVGRVPAWMDRLQRTTAPLLSRAPGPLQARVVSRARPSHPLLSPQPPTDDGPDALLEAGPLYAGETAARIDEVRPAAEITRELAGYASLVATLFMVPGSHPSVAAALMLERKGIDYRRIDFAPAVHRVALRLAGFRGRTVPALRIDGRRIQGSRQIARALDEMRPEPLLFPAGADARRRVEEAEAWGDEVLQPLARRLAWAALKRDRSTIGSFLEGARLGVPTGVAVRTAPPLIHLTARLNAATDEAARADLAALPARLDRVDTWIGEGVLGGAEPNAADFQIAASLRLLMALDDVRPAIEGRPAGRLSRKVVPEFPGRANAVFPADWLAPLRFSAAA